MKKRIILNPQIVLYAGVDLLLGSMVLTSVRLPLLGGRIVRAVSASTYILSLKDIFNASLKIIRIRLISRTFLFFFYSLRKIKN